MAEPPDRFGGSAAGPRMGRKEIDLNDPALFAIQRRLPGWSVGAVAIGALGVALLVGGWLQWQRGTLRASMADIDARTATLRAEAPAQADPSVALQAEIARLRTQLVQIEGARDARAVSTVLDALATATVDGVWLTRVRFDRLGDELRIEGRTRDARLLPRYLQSLGRQPAFSGMPLATLEASRGEGAAGGTVAFKIVSARGGTAPAAGQAATAAQPPLAAPGPVPAAAPARSGAS